MISNNSKINNSSEEKSLKVEAKLKNPSFEIESDLNRDLEQGILDNKCDNLVNIGKDGKEIVNPKKNKIFSRIRLSNNNNIFLTLYTIVGYFFTSIAIIYYNHWLFDKVAPFPVFATWVQQIVGVFCFGILSLSRRTPNMSKMNKDSSENSGDSTNLRKENETRKVNATSTNCTSNENISAKELEAGSNRSIPIEISFQENSVIEETQLKDSSVANSSQNIRIEETTVNEKAKQKRNSIKFSTEMKKLLKILPMSICFVGLVAFGNICLKYVQVSTYQLARSGSLIFTVIVSYFMLGQKQTWQSILACIVVCAGFLIGSLDRSTLSAMGIVTGLASSFCQVFYNVFMKKCMNYFNGDAIQLMKYNQCISTILLIPCIFLARELELIMGSAAFNTNSPEFFRLWTLLILCGLLSMLLNYFTFLVVGYTSPVTFNVLGMFKSCAQTAGGFIIFHDHASVHTITGICLTLAGSVWYGFAKSLNCNSGGKSSSQSEVGSENGIVISKPEFEQKVSILTKELSEVEELCYSSDVIHNKKYNYEIFGDLVDHTNTFSGAELTMISPEIKKCVCQLEKEGSEIEIKCGCKNDQREICSNKNRNNGSDEKINGTVSLSSCISNGRQESQYTGNTLTTKSSEQKDLENLFEKFSNISRESSTDLKSSMSKISVSMPASVYASPVVESRQISADEIPNNRTVEASNDNISLDVSIIVESEREAAGNDIQGLSGPHFEGSDTEESTTIT
ncbi:Sugar phosphate transporter domain containing protein [Cryptosporidium hominis]|uniref:Sugar phosphate transporter domain containing protein n=1 Tax=Cryptosporidium hominis TaxID=237895 RepID=A0ABX5BGI1_CRYHO|nr:GDP-fucose transporter 1 [Cryptosporidium hominis TU502]PPS96269.1 Sugar phosphate transporter domain containing protein [Cryptosporidium hominis]|eukprot:PPS96269.1 Sugar phosphate transporter domain containing protein [Cryptosporidium hominis]